MGHFNVDDLRIAVFLIGAGAVTATPLVLFSIGANDLPLNVLGSASIFLHPSLCFWGYSFSANPLPVHSCLLFLLSGQLLRSLRLRTGGKEVFGKTGNERLVKGEGNGKHFIGV